MNIKFFLFTFNRPDLLERQIKSIQKYSLNDFEINVVHDSRNNEFVDSFESVCKKNQVRFFHHNSKEGNTPSYYHADTIQWAYDNIILKEQNNDLVILLDHDMFLIDDLDFESYMKNYDVAGCLQTRGSIKYFWPGMFLFKTDKISDVEFNFYPQQVNNEMLDTGGGTFSIFDKSEIRYKDTGVEYPEDYKGIPLNDNSLTNGYNYELHLEGKFLHYRNACNWNSNYEIKDQTKTELLYKILNDLLDDKNKENFEIVVSRYNEDLSWTENISRYCTIYNKGNAVDFESINLSNIGREAHTYLHHIVKNYNNLSEYTAFLQGDPFNPHSPRLLGVINYILESNELIPDFFWLSERIVESDFEYKREPYHTVFPNIRYAYKMIFGDEPTIETFTFGAGAQFVVSKNVIRSKPIEFYKNILNIFEYEIGENSKDSDSDIIKLLGNPGINEKYCPNNPELAYHMERFWGLIFLTENN